MTTQRHIAGPCLDGVQRCVKCGRVIIDAPVTTIPPITVGFTVGLDVLESNGVWDAAGYNPMERPTSTMAKHRRWAEKHIGTSAVNCTRGLR